MICQRCAKGEIMNDRELLELAAKAAGIELGWNKNDTPPKPFRMDNADWWDPLTDDGDALRLAVKLRLKVEINERSTVVYWIHDESEKSVYEYPDSVQGKDYDIVHVGHDKASRRAIVCAAAEIWRKKS